MNHKKWIVIFATIASVCIIWFFLENKPVGTMARIEQNGNIMNTIDLNSVTEPYDIEVISEDGGHNTIHIERGAIGIIDADCPDKICVHQGMINTGVLPIVCLPHKLVITIIGTDNEFDSIAGAR